MTKVSPDSPYVCIIAGGAGTRLWPKSRRAMPKQHLNLLGDRSLIRETLNRILPLTPCERIFLVTLESLRGAIWEQLPEIPPGNVIGEPWGRNTAMAIGLATAHVARADPRAVMISIGADHYVGDAEAFGRTLLAAAEAARSGDHLVTVGIEPRSAHAGYGYIRRGQRMGVFGGIEVFHVLEFKEKPSAEVAGRYVKSGDYFWNSNYFAWSVPSVLAAFERFAPGIKAAMDKVGEAIGTPGYAEALVTAYKEVPVAAIDTAIMEKARNVLTVPGRFHWADVGSWAGAYEIARTEDGNFRTGATQGRVVFHDSRRCLVDSHGRLVAVVGLEDVVVVDTADALLVCSREKAEQVGEVVRRLGQEGLDDLL